MTLIIVALGGAFGAVARYLLGSWVQAAAGPLLPWGTLAVNVSGSLAIGFVAAWLQHVVSPPGMRELVIVGFLGSFTTFSSITIETIELLRLGAWVRATGYTLGSLGAGLASAAVGIALATAIFQRPA